MAIKRYVNEKTFVAMNGDELVDLSIHKLESFHNWHKGLATIAVSPLRSPYGIVDVDERSKSIVRFREKAIVPKTYVSTGVYIFDRNILRHIPHRGDIERTAFPMARRQKTDQSLCAQRFLENHKHTQRPSGRRQRA